MNNDWVTFHVISKIGLWRGQWQLNVDNYESKDIDYGFNHQNKYSILKFLGPVDSKGEVIHWINGIKGGFWIVDEVEGRVSSKRSIFLFRKQPQQSLGDIIHVYRSRSRSQHSSHYTFVYSKIINNFLGNINKNGIIQ